MGSELNRQQICAALGVSESTIRRLEQLGLPFTPVGARSKRYDLDECKAWLRSSYSPATQGNPGPKYQAPWTPGKEFTDLCSKVRLRVMPS